MAVVTSDSRVRILKLTPLGLHARAAHESIVSETEANWRSRFGDARVRRLRRHWNTSSQGRLAQVAQLVVAKPRFPREC